MHPPKPRARPRPRQRILLLLLPLLLLFLFRPQPSLTSPSTNPVLPIHQICLHSCPTHATTTHPHSKIILSPSTILSHVTKLPNHTVLYITSSCVQTSSNALELLYLGFLHHRPAAIVPYVDGGTLDSVFPIMTTPTQLVSTDFEQALVSISPKILELPSATGKSQCNILSRSFDRHKITTRSSNRLSETLFLSSEEQHVANPLQSVPFTAAVSNAPVVLFAMPWLQMGGSEQSMLRLAEYAITQGYTPCFMLLQPFFGESDGRLVTRNDWITRAYALTPCVYDVVNLAPFHRRAQIMRYVFDVHNPEFVITANSRLFYNLLPMVRFLLPSAVLADYTHMVHQTWLGGGMPRYAANNTAFLDRHFTASGNVTNSIQTWVQEDGVSKDKAQTCYIGADVKPFHRGIRKSFVRRVTRAGMGIANDKILVLFAGRFVLDKGIDVLVEVMTRINNPRFAFLLVGSGAMETLVRPLEERGRVVIRPGASDIEMAEYYAASDVLLLPSVKEGIALVLYEAMANGLLVITTDVGGQRELVTPERGVLLKRGPTLEVASKVLNVLVDIPKRGTHYSRIRRTGERVVRERFTTERFVECVFSGMKNARRTHKEEIGDVEKVKELVRKTLKIERRHGDWALRVFPMSVSCALTVVQLGSGEISGMERYENLSIVKKERISDAAEVDTEAALILPAGYDVSNTDLQAVINALRRPVGKVIFDMIGLRTRDAKIGRLMLSEDGVEQCGIREDLFQAVGDKALKSLDAANVVELHDVYAADVLGQVFMVRTERLRKSLMEGRSRGGMKAGELFLVAKMEGWNVGYVHDVVVEGRGEKVWVEDANDVGMCDVGREDLLF